MKNQNLRLEYNFNNKLDCDCFSVIQPLNPILFTVGNTLEVYLKQQALGQAEVLFHRELREDQISNWIAYLDTGYNRAQALQMLRRAFRTTKQEVIYSLALLKYVRRYDFEDFLKQQQPKRKTLPLIPV